MLSPKDRIRFLVKAHHLFRKSKISQPQDNWILPLRSKTIVFFNMLEIHSHLLSVVAPLFLIISKTAVRRIVSGLIKDYLPKFKSIMHPLNIPKTSLNKKKRHLSTLNSNRTKAQMIKRFRLQTKGQIKKGLVCSNR